MRLAGIAVCLLWASGSAGADDQTGTIATVTAHLVEVHVVVHDKNGKPVPGLKSGDFLLKEQGKPQKLTVFSMERDAFAPVEDAAPGSAPSSPERAAAAEPRSAVILLDRLNSRLRDQHEMRRELTAFLRKAEPRTRLAIMVLTEDGKVRVLTDFTTDRRKLQNAVAADPVRLSELQRMSELDPLDPGDVAEIEVNDTTESARKRVESATEVRVRRTLDAIAAVARRLAHLPGRKSLVWMSGAFPFSMGYETALIMDPRVTRLNFEQQVARAMRVVTDANVAIYPVDVRGLFGVAMGRSDDPLLSGGFGAEGTQMVPSSMFTHQSMDAIAQATGGKAYYGRNDLGGAVREALDDSIVIYVLGFQPPGDEWDGRFHPLEVQVKPDGLKLRYRRGYFAVPDTPAARHAASLRQAVESPLDSAAIGLNAALRRESKGWKIIVTVDPRQLTLASEAGFSNGTLDMLFIEETSGGKKLFTSQLEVPLHWSPSSLEENLAHGARFNGLLDVIPSATRLRVVVRDRPSDRIGTITIPLDKIP